MRTKRPSTEMMKKDLNEARTVSKLGEAEEDTERNDEQRSRSKNKEKCKISET